jgi:hypothetical protein
MRNYWLFWLLRYALLPTLSSSSKDAPHCLRRFGGAPDQYIADMRPAELLYDGTTAEAVRELASRGGVPLD